MSDDSLGFGTRAVHAGHTTDPATGARALPLYQTTSYTFDDADHAAELYSLEAEGDVYTRISNPTVRILEDRLASLESGVAGVATASGMAAFDALVFVLASAGDTIVSSSDIYGGTTAYLNHTAPRRGVDPRFVDTLDYSGYEDAIDESTAFVHIETIGNPSLVTPDIDRIAEIAHRNGVPLVVDNTFATPALCRPIEHGADIVWESTTKWIHGSGTTIGGILVDGGSFEWTDYPEKYPEIGGPNPAFNGLTFGERFGSQAFAAAVRHRAIRSIGSSQSPFDAWQTLQGLETLPLRMAKHCENATETAWFLANHPDVEWVTYPGLPDHPTHENANQYLDDGYGGMIGFGVSGGYAAAKHFCETVELTSFLANVGDAKTLVIHPASTTHAQLTENEQRASGVTPDFVRLSVGLEEATDIITDLENAISQSVAEIKE